MGVRVSFSPCVQQCKVFSEAGVDGNYPFVLTVPRVSVTLHTISFSDSDRMCVNIKEAKGEEKI